MTNAEENYNFKFIDKKFDTISGKENKEYLTKWGMRGKLRTFTYTFDKQFHLSNKNAFILNFFKDSNVTSTLQRLNNRGTWLNLDRVANKVDVQDVDCTLLSVEIFDKLFKNEIVRENGNIRKCFDEYYEDIQISDELRKMLLLEESDHYDMYTDKERNEFLFRLFKHVCLGAYCCQFEDEIKPYIDVSRSIYKDLISVHKDPNTKALRVVSYVFKVEVFDENGKKFYPNDTIIEQDFCYLVIDPYKRQLIVLYHRFDGPLFTD